MIPLAAYIWFLAMPLWGVHDPVPWYEQTFEPIYEEPSLDDIERKIWLQELRLRLQTQEVQK